MSIREIRQPGPYCYTYSPFHPPIATVRPGETVLDLGSGAGLDSILAARKVGPAGRVIGKRT